MFEDPKRNQNQSDDMDYQGTQNDEGSAGGVASQDIGETGQTENTGDFGSSDLNQDNTDDDMTE